MRALVSLFAATSACLLWASSTVAAPPPLWRTVSPPGAGLSVQMPGQPKHLDQSRAKSPLGPVAHHIYQVRVKRTAAFGVYTFTYTRLLDGRSDAVLTADAWLDFIVARQIANYSKKAEASVASRRKHTVAGHPGREVVLKAKDALIRVRVVVIGSRAVVLSGIVPHAKAMTPAVDRFQASLRIQKEK